jgi:hypothetical protein
VPIRTAERPPVGGPVENIYSLQDHYRMSSAPISVDPAALRVTADGNRHSASYLTDYEQQCQEWLGQVESEIFRCHGAVAAPVGSSLRQHFDRISAQAAATAADQTAMADKIAAAAGRYEEGDAQGAEGIRTAGGVV